MEDDKARFDVLNAQIKTEQTGLRDKETALTAAQEKNDAAKSRIEQLKKDLQKTNDDLASNQRDHTEKTNQLSQLKSDLVQKEAALTAANNSLTQKETDHSSTKEQLDAAKAKMEQLEKDLKKLTTTSHLINVTTLKKQINYLNLNLTWFRKKPLFVIKKQLLLLPITHLLERTDHSSTKNNLMPQKLKSEQLEKDLKKTNDDLASNQRDHTEKTNQLSPT